MMENNNKASALMNVGDDKNADDQELAFMLGELTNAPVIQELKKMADRISRLEQIVEQIASHEKFGMQDDMQQQKGGMEDDFGTVVPMSEGNSKSSILNQSLENLGDVMGIQ